MRIVGFVEGAPGDTPGIVSVPMILMNTASLGHSVVLLIGGPPSLGSDKFLVPDVESALARKEGRGTFGVISVKAKRLWSFCPSMLWRFSKLVSEADFITLHSLYPFPILAGFILASWHKKPYGIYPHGVLSPFQRTVSVRKKWLYNKLFVNRMLRNASVLFFSTEGEREGTADMRLSAPSVIVPDGFDPIEFTVLPKRGAFRKRFFGGHDGPLVLFLARLNVAKGLDLLLKAMRIVIAERPDVRLAIVGPPHPASFNKEVIGWVSENGLESQTVLTGAAYGDTRLQAFADADVYVLPSQAENFGFSVFEAMASGLPVVVSETLSLAQEFARSGGAFVLPRTPDAFSAAILELVDQPKLRKDMGECGRAFARHYSPEETGAMFAKTVESIVNRRPLPKNVSPVTPSRIRS